MADIIMLWVYIFLVGYACCSDLPLSRVSLYDKLVHTCVPASVNDRKLYCTWVCLSCGMIQVLCLEATPVHKFIWANGFCCCQVTEPATAMAKCFW